MSLEIQSNKLWEEIKLDSNIVKNTIENAKKDLISSKKIADIEIDWSYAIAYNGMLQAGKALMYFNRLRPRGEAKHYAIVEYLRKNYSELKDVIKILDKSRKKRHRLVYEEKGLISKEELDNLLSVSENFIKYVEKIVK